MTKLPEDDMRERGLQVLEGLGWGRDSKNPGLDDAFWEHTTENLFGRIWGRPGLSLREREIVTLAVLITVDAAEGIKPHLRNAHTLGITEAEMREIIIQAMYYAGWPKGSHAMLRFNAILNEPDSTWPKKDAAKT